MSAVIGIVIVNYNGAAYQSSCIQSILDSKYKNFVIIVVDNNSSDNSMQMLDEFVSENIVKIFCPENYGVAKGNNIGIQKSKELGCKYTLLLNNDTVLTEELLSKLIVEAGQGEQVIVPKIYYYGTQVIWYGGGVLSHLKCTSLHLNFRKTDENIQFQKYYEYAPTCCMLINNDVFDSVGLFDENYFLYFDDTDFCFRLKLNGINIRFIEDAVIFHKVSMSTGGEQSNSKVQIYYNNRNRFYFYNKFKKY
ncbi:MAG TPA: glycosyltransferase family 2 protein, partial [Clostridiales bacterium]|nr:glycosyltransferase family 2 protein [Clostridiales bacterium]